MIILTMFSEEINEILSVITNNELNYFFENSQTLRDCQDVIHCPPRKSTLSLSDVPEYQSDEFETSLYHIIMRIELGKDMEEHMFELLKDVNLDELQTKDV